MLTCTFHSTPFTEPLSAPNEQPYEVTNPSRIFTVTDHTGNQWRRILDPFARVRPRTLSLHKSEEASARARLALSIFEKGRQPESNGVNAGLNRTRKVVGTDQFTIYSCLPVSIKNQTMYRLHAIGVPRRGEIARCIGHAG